MDWKYLVSVVLGMALLTSMVAVASFMPQSVEASPYEGDTWIVDASGGGDFVTIQDAVAASSPGDTIRVYDGLYAENLFINKRLAIIGNGTDITTIDGQGLGNVITVNADDVTISGMNITGSPDHSGIIVQNRQGTVIEDNSIHNNGHGIRVQTGAELSIANNTIALNGWNGILLGSVQDSIIRDNSLLLNTITSLTLMLESNGNLVENNTVSDGGIGISIQDSSTMNTIRGNDIHGGSSDGIRLTGSDANHLENNTVNQNNNGLLLIDSYGNLIHNNTVNDNNQGVLFFNSHNNTFHGNDVSDNGLTGIYLEDSGFNVFLNNTVVDHVDHGLQASGSNNLTLVGNNISGQRIGADIINGPGLVFHDNDVTAVDDAIRVVSSASPSVRGNTFSGAEYGIRLIFSDDPVIWNNEMTGTDYAISLTLSANADVRFNEAEITESGLEFQNSDSGLAMDNHFSGGSYGIRIGSADDVQVMHNTVTDNIIGILIQDASSGNLIAYNKASGSIQYGITLSNSDENTIKGNELVSNFIGIQVSPGSDGNLLYNNNFLFNANHANDAGVNLWNETGAKGGGNYWQDFSSNPGFPDEYHVPAGANVDLLPLISPYDNIRPTADAGSDLIVGQNEAVLLSAGASTDNVGITNHTWEFNDGVSAVTSYLVALVHVFPLVGEYEVKLTVRDASGLEDSDIITVTVLDTEKPVAVAGADVLIPLGDIVGLNASASTDNVGITSYNWTFHDGIGEVSYDHESVQHQFNRSGIFTITLKVFDAAGNNGTDTKTVSVNLTLTIGPVIDDEGPLGSADVSVRYGQTWYNASTDSDGMAVVELPPAASGSNVALIISMQGYEETTLTTVANADGTLADALSPLVAEEETESETVLVVAIAAMIFFMAYMLGRFRR